MQLQDAGAEQGEEIPHAQGQEQQPRGDTPYPRSGKAPVRRYHTSKVRSGAGESSYPMLKVRSGGCEEIPHTQGQEQSGERRHPTSKVKSSSREEIPHAQGQEEHL